MDDDMQPDQRPATKDDLKHFATKSDLKSDINEMKSDMHAMKTELVNEIRGFGRQFALEISNLKTDVSDIRSYIKDKLVTRDEFHARMDGFTRRVEDHDWSAAKNRDRIDDHEKRIQNLERKSS